MQQRGSTQQSKGKQPNRATRKEFRVRWVANKTRELEQQTWRSSAAAAGAGAACRGSDVGSPAHNAAASLEVVALAERRVLLPAAGSGR